MTTNTSVKADVKLPIKQIPPTTRLVWIYVRINDQEPHFQQTLELLKHVAEKIQIFREINPCVRFIQEQHANKVLVISSGALGLDLVRQIHPMGQVESIYLFCASVDYHAKWARDWPKIKGIHNSIVPICLAIQKNISYAKDEDDLISFLSDLQDGGNIA